MARAIESSGRAFRAAPLWWSAGLLLFAATIARGETVHGAQLPAGAQKVGENRYRAAEDFDGVLKYYKTVYPTAAYPRKPIVNRPDVKAVHIANPSMKNFEGLNIYVANDEVRIYVIPVAETKPMKKKGSDRATKK